MYELAKDQGSILVLEDDYRWTSFSYNLKANIKLVALNFRRYFAN